MKHKKSWYVFEYKRGRKTPKGYEGPYATKAEAASWIAREHKKYGRESFVVTYFKIRHLTAEEFSKAY